MKNYSLLIVAFLGFSICFAQNTKPSPASGRNITITLSPLKNCKVYLGSYMGKGRTLADSCLLDANGKGVFKGNTKLTPGIYFVVSPQLTIQFDLLMDRVQHFSIVADTAQKENALIKGSPDNDLYKSYAIKTTEMGIQMNQLERSYRSSTTKSDSLKYRDQILAVDKALQEYREQIIKNNPESLLSFLLTAMKRPAAPAIPIINGKADSTYPYRYVKEHYWDDVLFNDDRLLRTPFFEPKLDDYFKNLVYPDPDSIFAEIKYMLLMARTGKEIFPYLLTKFTNKYMNPEIMGQDKVFVYLYEEFYAKGDTIVLNQASRKTITDRAYSLMYNLLGKPAAELNLTDTTGKKQSLYGLFAPLTMVLFWDPNCGHCKEELPRIDSFYQAKWKPLGMKVYSVNIYENELSAWKKFIHEHHLPKEWIHAYEKKEDKMATEKAGVPNFRQLYDIYKTPTIYLLDKEKRIIAKHLSLEQFDDLISAKTRGSEKNK